MRYIALVLVLFVSTTFAQQKKYQGLLWEISGNGLEKNSYLYGSMHVSDKISYHLSDAFFKHLLEADIVANESEPSTWIGVMDVMTNLADSYGYGGQQKLYAEFYLAPTTKEDLFPLFRTRNFTIDNLLFRTNEYQKEYQEETYLDMFIYRTGRKYSKKTVGLEDTKQSLLNMMDLDYDAMKPKEENRVAMQRILKNADYDEALMNYYREKDLDMLDSLTTLASGEAYLKSLLYDRNEVFAKSIDSIVKTGSLFAAVGAAHLPGKKGLIELLRAKGYTVKAVQGNYTNSGKEKKEMIESYFKKPDFETYTSADGMISLPVFKGAVIEDDANIQSPDLANGGYINVKRLLLKDYLAKDNRPFNHKSLDSLFYENIPGKITDKKFYSKDGYDIYDIKNTTKTGNAQHYRYYITPLEIIMVSMAGERDYVLKFEDALFSNIQLQPLTTGFRAVSPKKGVFSVTMPAYTAIYGESNKNATATDDELYGYDPNEKAGYFVLERTAGDTDNLEDTAFELQRIHYEFYRQLGADTTNTKMLTGNPAAFTSSSKIGNKAISLKSVISGPKYFLLGSVGATEARTQAFFNSFTLQPAVPVQEYRTFTDTTAHYSITVPKKENEALDFQPKLLSEGLMYGRHDKDIFREKFSSRSFTLPSGQKINLMYHKMHRYNTVQSVDSVWNKMERYITGANEENGIVEDYDTLSGYIAAGYDYSNGDIENNLWNKVISSNKQTIKQVNNKKSYHKEGDYYTFEGTAVADNSTQAVKFWAAYRNGETYVLNTMVDKDDTAGPAVEKVFSSFTLLEAPDTDNFPDNRLLLFIEDARSEHDSIREAALGSIRHLVVTKKDIPVLQDFIKDFDFEKEETDALTSLYDKLADTGDAAVIPFMEQQYKRKGTNTIIQFAVLRALTALETDEAYKKIGELLEYDLPIPDRQYEVTGLFKRFSLDTEHSAVLFPDVLQYYSIPEYQEPVVAFTASLLEDETIKPKKLKAYKKMLLTNAKLEIKRAKSRLAVRESGDSGYYNAKSSNLDGYLELLYPFRNDKDVKAVFTTINELDVPATSLEMARLQIVHDDIDPDRLNSLLQKPEMLFKVQALLAAHKQTSFLKNISDTQIAESAITTLGKLNVKKDSLIFIREKTVPLNGKTVTFFFYKIKSIGEDDDDNGYYDYGTADKIAAIAFLNSSEEKINPLVYKYTGTKRILDDSETDETIATMVDATLNATKTRATFAKIKKGSYNDMVEVYDDEY